MDNLKKMVDKIGGSRFPVEQSAAVTTEPMTYQKDENGLYRRVKKSDRAIVYTALAPDSEIGLVMLEKMVVSHCDKHNIDYTEMYLIKDGMETNPDKNACPLCVHERDEKRIAEERERDRIARIENRVLLAGVPKRHASASFESYIAKTPEQKMALHMMMEYAKDFESHKKTGKSVLLVGTPGTGKTHLAISVIRANAFKDCIFKYICLSDFMTKIKESWTAKGKRGYQSDIIAEYGDADLVILDEIGVQFGSDTERDILFQLINKRYGNMKPTIFISNQTVAKTKELIGESSFDRLTDNGGILIPFTWESYRKTRTA